MRTLPVLLATTAAAAISLTVLPGAPAGATDEPPGGEVVRAWATQALDAVRAAGSSDAAAARTYALVQGAVYDAVNAIEPTSRRRTSAIVDLVGTGDQVVAAATAAHDVLVALFPGRAASLDAALATEVAKSPRPKEAAEGRAVGQRVAAAVLTARAADGASADPETQPGDTSPGAYPVAWPGAQWRGLKPFVIDDPAGYVGSGPPALSSVDWKAARAEVEVLGSATPVDTAKSATYSFWNLSTGTDQPAGAWLQVGQAVSAALSLQDTARLLALESLAMADTVGPTYQTKWVHHSWRPAHAIRVDNPAWNPRGGVGSSPEYWSGHSSFSAAAATVLTAFFCDDRTSFSLTSDGTKETRTYRRFSEAMQEAGRSRVLGGLHFSFSNEAGLAAGRAVAEEVLGSALLRTRGLTHQGACPV